MRSGIVTIGIVLLVIGIGLYMIASMKIEEYQSLLGQFSLIISSEAEQQFHMFQLMQMMGAVSAAAGVIVSIAGISAKSGE
jgi:hypothetical protein